MQILSGKPMEHNDREHLANTVCSVKTLYTRSTTSALLLFTEQIRILLNKGHITGVIFIVFCKEKQYLFL